MATVWRCPPESAATGTRTVGILAESWREQLPAADLHLHVVQPQAAQLGAQEEVLHHVEVLAQGEVLEDGGDAEVAGVGR